MEEPISANVVYRSLTHPTQSWDVIQVVYQYEDATAGTKRTGESFIIARDGNGAILRKTDILFDRWETVTENDLLQFCQSHFDARDRLTAQGEVGSAAL
jgi:hypothetical protein